MHAGANVAAHCVRTSEARHGARTEQSASTGGGRASCSSRSVAAQVPGLAVRPRALGSTAAWFPWPPPALEAVVELGRGALRWGTRRWCASPARGVASGAGLAARYTACWPGPGVFAPPAAACRLGRCDSRRGQGDGGGGGPDAVGAGQAAGDRGLHDADSDARGRGPHALLRRPRLLDPRRPEQRAGRGRVPVHHLGRACGPGARPHCGGGHSADKAGAGGCGASTSHVRGWLLRPLV